MLVRVLVLVVLVLVLVLVVLVLMVQVGVVVMETRYLVKKVTTVLYSVVTTEWGPPWGQTGVRRGRNVGG